MSEFVKGDRVEVRFEAEVTHYDKRVTYIVTDEGLNCEVPTSALELIPEYDLPTEVGSVIQWVDTEDYAVCIGSGLWVDSDGSIVATASEIDKRYRIVRRGLGL